MQMGFVGRFWLAAAAAMVMVFTASAATDTRLKITSISDLSQLSTPLPYPYDEKANADRVVDAALAKAKAEHKLAFIDLGGNWCADCRILSGLMDLPEVKPFVESHYVVAMVDVGRFNKNLQIPARWGIVDRLEGVPAILIIDPDDDSLVDRGHFVALDDARHMTPQAIADWMARWAK
ncbi:MAG TPA: thioredoxin family protein [Rhizomicrobium sp.]|nr:thioredoxin family protein [Rhizomicrobium sp.]